MPRKIKEGLDYFPHDVNLSSDKEIKILEAEFKNDGYAVYLKLLEDIYREGGSLVVDDSMEKVLAKECNVSVETFKGIVELCLVRKLFCTKTFSSKKILTSDGIKKRIKPIARKRAKERAKYRIVSDDGQKQK